MKNCHPEQQTSLWQGGGGNDTAQIAMESRPGGPPAKHSPARKGWDINPEDRSAVGAALIYHLDSSVSR
jgi:hypothetical protein